MIHIVRGPEAIVRSHCQHLYSEDRDLWFETSDGIRRYWSGFRLLLPQLRQRTSDGIVQDALWRHRVVASLVLGQLRETLSPHEKNELEQLKAKTTSHLSHNWYLDRPVLFGLTELLAEIFSSRRFRLFVPNFHTSEPVFFSLYITLHRQFPEATPDLVVGIPTDTATGQADEHGVVWEFTSERARNILMTLQTFPAQETVDLASIPARYGSRILDLPDPALDPLDDDLDGRAFKILRTDQPLTVDQIALVIAGAQRSFEAFSRDTALRLALDLLDRQPPLSRQQAALLHGMAGLAAHNWQFASEQGDARLTDFLEDHFRQALALEDDPVARLCLLYRLAVTLGRRRKDLQSSLEIANQAVAEAQRADIPEETRVYQEVWARNIRAYVHMRRGDMAQAFVDSETSLRLVERLTTPLENASRDFRFTRTVLADNNQVLCRIAGEHEKLELRTRKNFELLEQDPESFGGRFSAPSWIYHYRGKYRLDLAIRAARYGLEDAGRHYPPLRWYFLSHLGDLHYRQGDADRALRYFEEASTLRPRVRGVRDMVHLSEVLVAIRTGQLDRAAADLDRALLHPKVDSPLLRAEILAVSAVVAARLRDIIAAESRMNQAIDLAAEQGVRDSLVRIARLTGTVAQLLGREEEARQAYRQGLEIAEVESELEPPPGDVAALCLGLVDCGAVDSDDLLLRSLELMPRALHEDPEAWWDLPRLLPRLDTILGTINLEANGYRGALAQLAMAAAQRVDCAGSIEEWLRSIPPALIHQEAMVV